MLPLTYNGKMIKLHFYAPPQKKRQVYYDIPSECFSVCQSVQVNIQSWGNFGAIYDIIMRYFEVYSI